MHGSNCSCNIQGGSKQKPIVCVRKLIPPTCWRVQFVNGLLLPDAPHREAGERTGPFVQWSDRKRRVRYLCLDPTGDHCWDLLLPLPGLIRMIDFSYEIWLADYLEDSPFPAAPQQLTEWDRPPLLIKDALEARHGEFDVRAIVFCRHQSCHTPTDCLNNCISVATTCDFSRIPRT